MPLIMLGLLLGVWVSARAALWESPFVSASLELPGMGISFAEGGEAEDLANTLPDLGRSDNSWVSVDAVPGFGRQRPKLPSAERRVLPVSSGASALNSLALSAVVAAGHRLLMAAAFRVNWTNQAAPSVSGTPKNVGLRLAEGDADTFAAPFFAPQQSADRWSLDAFAFYRAGSGSTSISQGRVPVYGASQMAVNLQYRAALTSPHDPRAYLRAYRAFVPDGENEVAAGLSARPLGSVPVRLGAELRVTDNIFGTEVRPAAYAVTELQAVTLPFDLRAEAYGGAGYVGGRADTAYADGQVAITREIVRFGGADKQSLRLSVGGASWGGAQRDASRLDVGPTLRIDMQIADVPARLAVDWRERIAGDAAPNSGIAATLSTRF